MSISILGMTVQSSTVSLFILAFIVGMCVPFKYGIERLRGFGRAALVKLPYKPPEAGGSVKKEEPARDEKGRFK